MSTLLPLTPDQLLSTTRSVRKRLDLERPVDLAVIRECIDVATQAPTGGNNQGWHWLVVTDPEKKRPIAEWYRDAFKAFYGRRDDVLERLDQEDPAYVATTRKVIDSADYLADHIGEVPVWVIACIEGRTDNGLPLVWQASQWGSLHPGGVELPAGRPRSRPGELLHDAPPGQGEGVRRAARHPRAR